MSELTVLGALKSGLTRQKALSMVPGAWRNYGRTITEPFAGAWQKNVEEKQADLLSYPTLYACINRISSDIGKLPFSLRKREKGGNWVAVENAAYDPVLRKPNDFQTPAQFREHWMLSKLTAGNTYVLKRRDARGVVNALYILVPERCMPMISESGFVFYQLQTDALNSLPAGYPAEGLVVPASEIIHDRCMTIFHPLVGVPPVAAAHWPALKNMKILRSATEFFTNNARPGGLLTGPAGMTDEEAKEVKAYWETNFSGSNAGKLAIIGADMKFTPFDMKSIDAQMVEQMSSSDEQICQPFGIPPFKVGIGSIPAGMKVDDMNQLYYSDALQTHIEHMETLLDQGLAIAAPLGVELDLDPLLRMDEGKRAEVESKLVQGKIKTPNEARARFNLAPTGGGGTLWGQHQDYPLAVLEKRKDVDPVPAQAPAAPAPAPAPAPISEEDQATVDAAKAIVSTQKAIAAMRKAANPETPNV